MINNKKYLKSYILSFFNNVSNSEKDIDAFLKFSKILKSYEKKNNIVHVFGNGGSASIASHFSMDITNNTNIKCLNYNDASLITCYSNDFGFNNWISRAIEKYGKKNDLLVVISSSGKSKNMINGIKTSRKKKFSNVITLTGFNKNNPVKKAGDLNFWLNSKEYNIVENIHQFWLLMIVDLIKKNL